MSRSYKKHMGGSYSGSSDKYSRSVYHRSKRRAYNQNCYELCKKYEVKQIFESTDDLLTDKIVSVVDYSCKYADRWSWVSDGGSFLMETDFSLRVKFNSEIFGLKGSWRHRPQTVWQRYQYALKSKYLYSYDFVDMVVSKNLAEKEFQNFEELIIWFRENQKWLIEVWKKLNYGK